MSQLTLDVANPLRFDVYATDGRLLDTFTEADLVCYDRHPEKALHEASLWAVLAIGQDRDARPEMHDGGA